LKNKKFETFEDGTKIALSSNVSFQKNVEKSLKITKMNAIIINVD